MQEHRSQTTEQINSKKVFTNTDGGYLMYIFLIQYQFQSKIREKAKKLEKENVDLFFRFVCMGKAMIDYADRGDLENFERLLRESDDQELMFWHVTKGLKAAVKNRRINIITYIIDELEMSLQHEAFEKYLHLYLFGCQEAEMENDDVGIEINREILRLLVKGKGKEGIDEVEKVSSSTPLIVACEHLHDLEMIKILVEAGADVNAVTSDDKMPLILIKERLASDMTNTKLEKIYDYLEEKGAKLTWRDKSNNY
ncbi:ankyrin repeat domain protein [Stylonychia lemnae]|uniref:Ankyrin repeat domain protein n=1 Tax=Stylonychia lemnae TaxID=5949 RepID=A0A078AH96_STYLE|nr:ankyrin repeat domain protein [Stylonychia lemnae]|eukprot:CDW81211.1 ankyrin repeat domain protein [Stylonychia lemnae]